MFAEIWQRLTDWHPWDTWIVVTAALTAMACSLPGLWLVLRKQSMMGDALSHTALPGVVVSFLAVTAARSLGWITEGQLDMGTQIALILGAVLMGIVTTLLTEWLQKLAGIDGGASLGVVFTGLFAIGLVLIRTMADDLDLDPDCVLFGQLESIVWRTWSIAGWEVPQATVLTAVMLGLNGLLTVLFFKELRLASFDAELATTQGINARAVHYLHMALTAATVTAAFQSVGSILVIALLVVPAVTALQLSWRLRHVVVLTLLIAAISAGAGHVLAKVAPPLICGPLGWPAVQDASTSGMVCVAAGLGFVAALLLGPRGVVWNVWCRAVLAMRIADEDLLGQLYRAEESTATGDAAAGVSWLILLRLRWQELVKRDTAGRILLTEFGLTRARDIVRRHRLWEAYMQKHFALPDDHLHDTAHRVEHYIDPALLEALDAELETPATDPHGKRIPG